MFTLPIGLMMMALTIFLSVDYNAWPLFANWHSLGIVFGGTFAILILATPSKVLVNLFSTLIGLTRKHQSESEMRAELAKLAVNRNLSTASTNPLISQAVNLWESGIDPEFFVVIMAQKRDELETRGADAVTALRNLAKYPPALGMTGTVIGLVSLFSNLGGDARSSMGPALALAMTATFFGLVLANALIMPLADRLQVDLMTKRKLYSEAFESLRLINAGESLEWLRDESGTKNKAA